MRHNIKEGELVMWQLDLICEDLSETGIVIEIVADSAGIPGAKVAWKSGVYWSPVELIRSIKDYHALL